MNKWQSVAMIGAILGMSAAPAWAYFQVDKEPAPPGLHCGGSRVEELGTGHHTRVKGSGAGVPIQDAAPALAPKGWYVQVDKKVRGEPVSWHNGDGWVQALTDNAPKNICFVVDFRNHNLVIGHHQITMAELKQMDAEREQDAAKAKKAAKTKKPVLVASASTKRSAKAKKHSAKPKHSAAKVATHHTLVASAHTHHAAASKAAHAAAQKQVQQDVGQASKQDHTELRTIPLGGANAVASANNHAKVDGDVVNHDFDVAFHAKVGSRLSASVTHFLKRYGWDVAWDDPQDFMIKYPLTVDGKTLRDVLSRLSQLYPLQIRLYEANRVAEIVSATNAMEPIGGNSNG